jgi:hypothetical protein
MCSAIPAPVRLGMCGKKKGCHQVPAVSGLTGSFARFKRWQGTQKGDECGRATGCKKCRNNNNNNGGDAENNIILMYVPMYVCTCAGQMGPSAWSADQAGLTDLTAYLVSHHLSLFASSQLFTDAYRTRPTHSEPRAISALMPGKHYTEHVGDGCACIVVWYPPRLPITADFMPGATTTSRSYRQSFYASYQISNLYDAGPIMPEVRGARCEVRGLRKYSCPPHPQH